MTRLIKIYKKAKQISTFILKYFKSRNPALLVIAFITYVRPILDYASVAILPCMDSVFIMTFVAIVA